MNAQLNNPSRDTGLMFELNKQTLFTTLTILNENSEGVCSRRRNENLVFTSSYFRKSEYQINEFSVLYFTLFYVSAKNHPLGVFDLDYAEDKIICSITDDFEKSKLILEEAVAMIVENS